MTRHPLARILVASILALSSLAVGQPEPPSVAAATDRLPDLRAARIRDLRIEKHGNRRLLRFTGIMWNQGKGPFEIRASRPNTATAWDVDQLVFDSAGGHRRIQTPAAMRYAGDGHDHWHVKRMLSYHLWGASGTSRDAKIGFCFFDTDLIDGDLARSPGHRVYQQSMCGHRGSLKTRGGISVGWGDAYPWNFAYQWIDITGLKGGTFTIRSAVDLYGYFIESSETNNCAWSKIRFGSTGTKVTVLDTGFGCINDHATSPYAEDIDWAIETGVSKGCGADMFCTNDALTRGQVAGFMSRAFDLPPATKDWFTDDDADPNEVHIDRVVEAGLTKGCGGGRYCPDRHASRQQVARFVALALGLPEASTDAFDDDAGSTFEPYINEVVEAGIMTGCGERTFCPTDSVTRGQMARILHLALTLPAPAAATIRSSL